jgi:uncharacterized protein
VIKKNPFRFGDIVGDEYFADRKDELENLKSDIRSGQNVVIISPRRYGKSSLVEQAAAELRQEGVLTATIDLFGITSLNQLVDTLANVVYRDLARPLARAWHEATELLGRLQPHVVIKGAAGDLATVTISANLAAKDVARAVEDVLALPGEIATRRARQVALVLDEFQVVADIDRSLPATMRKVFQRQGHVSHVFLGSQQSLMTRLFTEKGQPMYRLAKRVPLGPIPIQPFGEFINQGFRRTGTGIEEEAVGLLLGLTARHPYHTQELAHFTWNLAVAAGRPADVEMVRAAHEEVYRSESALFVAEWERLSAHQRRTLIAVALEPGAGVFSDEYRRTHNLGAASSVQFSIEQLLGRNLVQALGPGKYEVPDPYQRLWLIRLESQARGPVRHPGETAGNLTEIPVTETTVT